MVGIIYLPINVVIIFINKGGILLFKKETHEFYITFVGYEMISDFVKLTSRYKFQICAECKNKEYHCNRILEMMSIQEGAEMKIVAKIKEKQIKEFDNFHKEAMRIAEKYEDERKIKGL